MYKIRNYDRVQAHHIPDMQTAIKEAEEIFKIQHLTLAIIEEETGNIIRIIK